ncbi:ATPase WRNIP1 isoform X2 [Xenopus tropicalis]|uniref:ATPase WRNIP1 n=1 Tax=Xenopus tropicalis TaxID=8364 RepID=A0A8J1JMJ5_XENTR|nr:ATPase WRNIP1 isoform X2 [Xenopus tropicalis]
MMAQSAEVLGTSQVGSFGNNVQCPVCSLEISAGQINSHLDSCLQGKAVGGVPGKKRRLSSNEESGKEVAQQPGKQFGPAGPTFPLFNKSKSFTGPSECATQSLCTSPSSRKQGVSVSSAEALHCQEDDDYRLPQHNLTPDAKKPNNLSEKLNGKPLADKMRPTDLNDYMGQKKVLGENTLLRNLLQSNDIPSIILWGPPGCGKDTFLPHVECGTITLIGATTENPSFQVNTALLSRCRVIVLEKLSVEAMEAILMRAVGSLGIKVLKVGEQPVHSSSDVSETPIYVEEKALTTLAHLCDGDARTGLNGLQLSVQASLAAEKDPIEHGIIIKEEHIKEGLQRSHILYDRAGEEHYNCISALHKSMRGSDQNASLYWLGRMLEGGENPLYVARRLVRFASEDVGLADPQALTQAVSTYQACHFIGMPECEVILAQCVMYLACAPKSISVYSAYNKVKECLKNHKGPLPSVPLHLRNAPTKLMKGLGYGKGYKYNPLFSEPVEQDYMPEEMKGVTFV